ncbi:MAG: hypothetical protein ACKN9C_08185, partial [Fluviibacter sp.]
MEGLQQALGKAIERHSTQLISLENTMARVVDPADESDDPKGFWRNVELTADGKTTIVQTRLIVHAEGTPPDDSPGVIARGYGQRAIIFEAGLAQGHGQRAWERFTPHGPLALLPVDGVGGKRVSVVYTVPEQDAPELLALSDAAIL